MERFVSPLKLDEDEITTEIIVMPLSSSKIVDSGNFLAFQKDFQN